MTMLLELADTTELTADPSSPFDLAIRDSTLDDAVCVDPGCFYCCGPETD